MNRRTIVTVFVVVLALGAWMFYPLYPSAKSLCSLISERTTIQDRWATPHRGAVIVLSGVIYGGPEGMFHLETTCEGSRIFIAVEIPSAVVAGIRTRRDLDAIVNPNWREEDRSVPVRLIARVSSEVQSCFGPGMIVMALAVQSRGTPRSAPR